MTETGLAKDKGERKLRTELWAELKNKSSTNLEAMARNVLHYQSTSRYNVGGVPTWLMLDILIDILTRRQRSRREIG